MVWVQINCSFLSFKVPCFHNSCITSVSIQVKSMKKKLFCISLKFISSTLNLRAGLFHTLLKHYHVILTTSCSWAKHSFRNVHTILCSIYSEHCTKMWHFCDAFVIGNSDTEQFEIFKVPWSLFNVTEIILFICRFERPIAQSFRAPSLQMLETWITWVVLKVLSSVDSIATIRTSWFNSYSNIWCQALDS